MAIDTVRLRSPYISENLAHTVEQFCTLREGKEIKTNDILYSFTSGTLKGTWDNRISITVKREDWETVRGVTSLVPSKPYLIIEGSVHKLFLGHNVYGGPINFQSSMKSFIELIEIMLDAKLPDYDIWRVRRVDWAEVYVLVPEAIKAYFRGIRNVTFPRRKVFKYGLESLYSPGTTTTVKIYHKGPEFKKHDYARVKKQSPNNVSNLQEEANKRLRVEVEIHSKKLRADFNREPFVRDITDEYLINIHDVEISKLLKEGKSEMKTVRDNEEVSGRLHIHHKPATARRLYGLWLQFVTLGEDVVKDTMPKSSFYRDRNLLKDAGISWNNTNIYVQDNIESLLPRDFIPIRTDSRYCAIRLNDVDIRADYL